MKYMDLDFYRGKRVFVTGHTGFKGSWLCRVLVNAGAEVTGYSLPAPTEPNLFSLSGLEILKRHLYTHYALFMVYDTDKKQGYEMGKRFDLFLRQTDPVLAKWVSKNIPMVRIARRYDFKYDLVEHSPGAKMLSMKSRIVNKIRPSLWVRRLVYNRVTVRIGKLRFFTVGLGKAIKASLRKLCGSS